CGGRHFNKFIKSVNQKYLVKLNYYHDKPTREKEIEELTDKCGNEKIAKLLYKCKHELYSERGCYGYYCGCCDYIRWIPFNKFENIEFLAKGGFGEVYKATWINGYYNHCEGREVVLKRIYNSDNKILDILKEVKVYKIPYKFVSLHRNINELI